jgi:hypothetical protein
MHPGHDPGPGSGRSDDVRRDQATHNPEPASDAASTQGSWNAFRQGKEYRSIVHLPRYEITCDTAGNVIGQPRARDVPGISAGFTPVIVWSWKAGPHGFPYWSTRRDYVAGEKYAEQKGAWYDVDPKTTGGLNGGAVRVQYQVAVRAGTAENAGNPLLSGYSLPFVWTVVQTELHCDGSAPTVVTYSKMPSIVVYQDGREVFSDRQTSDWGGFIKAGGRGHVRSGHGRLYESCSAHGFALVPTATLTPDCHGLATGAPNWSGFTS